MGLANIAASNGWSQAFLGISIVMTGLVVLALAIGQIHKLVALWERRQSAQESDSQDSAATALADQCPTDLAAMLTLYRMLTESHGTSFPLKELYSLAAANDLPHPHITIRCLREDGHLIPLGDGLFTWND